MEDINEVIYQTEIYSKKADYKFQVTIFERDTVIISVGPSGCQTMLHIKREDLRNISKLITDALVIVDQNEKDAVWIKDPAVDVQR
jgi:hypothetical protein